MPLLISPDIDFDTDSLLRRLYAGVDGYVLSGKARERFAQSRQEALTYGELPFKSFVPLFAKCRPAPGEHMVDLGSGTGKLVLSAMLECPALASATGIELLPELTQAAEGARQRLGTDHPALAARIRMEQGDLLEVDWQHADIVFLHATCMEPALMEKVAQRAMALKSGARFMALGQALPAPFGAAREICSYRTAWHREGRAYLYTRP